MSGEITIIGGGLAGCEAAWQVVRQGGRARLFEMRPEQGTPAHKTDQLAEIVCSNSLKSDTPYNASWLLKQELRALGSFLLEVADRARVPAGGRVGRRPEPLLGGRDRSDRGGTEHRVDTARGTRDSR